MNLKKGLIALLTASMVFAGATAVFAEETETETESMEVMEVVWEDYEKLLEEHEEWQGSFHEIEDLGFKFYLPEGFEAEELSEDTLEQGYFAFFNKGDEASLGVMLIDTEIEDVTLEDYQEYLMEYYDYEAVPAMINEIPALFYIIQDEEEEPNDEILVAAFELAETYVLEVYFAPILEDELREMAEFILSSIQVIEE